MKFLKSLFVIGPLLGAFFVGGAALAQGVGQLGRGEVWGNFGLTQAPAKPTPLMTFPVVSGNLSCFNGTTGRLQDCATAPSLLAKRNVLPVFVDDPEYGCVGNGVANDTACISAAITAANGAREVVFSGKVYCTDPLKIGDGGLPVPPRIGGVSGYATTLLACGTSASPTLTYSNFSFDAASSVHDIRLRANGLHANGLLVHGCQFCSFERIRAQGATSYGIVVHGEPGYNVQYNSFRDILSRENSGGGWKFLSTNNAGDYYVAANHCSGLRAQSNIGDGVNIDYATVDCNGAEIEANTGYGINADHTKAGVWNPVHLEGNTLGSINATANTTNMHFQGGRIGEPISATFLACPSCSVDQTDGMGQNNGFLRPTGMAIGQATSNPGAGNINLGSPDGLLYNQGVAPTGTGAYVRAATPTLVGPTITGSFTATGLVTNADLANPATTVNGQICTLGFNCVVTAAASSMAVGSTAITSGTTLRVLYDNAGVLGEYTPTQLTALINPATATLSGALPAWPNNLTTFFRGDGTYATLNIGAISGYGTGVATALGIAVGSAGGPVLFNGAGGTPSSLTLTNATGLPTTGLTGTLQAAQEPAHTGDVTNTAGSLALAIGATKVTSAMLNADVFSTAHSWSGGQTFAAPNLGTPASGIATNLTGLPISTGLTGAGTGVLTALGVNVGTAGSVVVNGGGLGTPSSGVGTNITNVNAATLGGATFAAPGAIGSGTPGTGAFTTLTASTSVTSPLHIGGSAAGSTLTLESTSGTGTSDSIIFKTGSQVTAGTIATGGQWALGPNAPVAAATPLLDVNSSAAATAVPTVSTVTPTMRLLGANAGFTSVAMQNYGSQNIFQMYQALGTAAAPTTLTNDSTIFNFQGWPYDGTNYGNSGLAQASVTMRFATAENLDGTHHGTKIVFGTTPTATVSRADAVTIQASGGMSVGTSSDPGIGLIYQNSASFLMRTKTSWSTGAAGSAGTLTNAPSAGNPTKWIPVDDNGTTRYIPAW